MIWNGQQSDVGIFFASAHKDGLEYKWSVHLSTKDAVTKMCNICLIEGKAPSEKHAREYCEEWIKDRMQEMTEDMLRGMN